MFTNKTSNECTKIQATYKIIIHTFNEDKVRPQIIEGCSKWIGIIFTLLFF